LTLHKLHTQLLILGFNFLDLLIKLMKIMPPTPRQANARIF
jgi:hypothetical protein